MPRTAPERPPILSKMSLHGWKTYGEGFQDLELKPLNVLIGSNGSGKSNFISFFKMLGWIPDSRLQYHIQEVGGASTLLHDGPDVSQKIVAALTFLKNNSSPMIEYGIDLSYAAGDTLIFEDERHRLMNPVTAHKSDWTHFTSGGRESGIADRSRAGDIEADLIYSFFRQCTAYQFHNTAATAKVRNNWEVDDNLYLRQDASNLASYLLRLRDESRPYYARIVDTIQLVAPYFSDFTLEPQNDRVMLRYSERDTGFVFGAHQMSDGTLRAIALITLLLQPEQKLPAITILDEPELGLHPYAISVIAGLLKSASLHSQIIVATQSATLLDHFNPEDVMVADRVGRESRLRRLNPVELKEWLAEYTLSELWEKNVLGGTPQG